MIIRGVDFHPEFQQIAYLDSDTGELTEKRLGHREEAERFYRTLVGSGLRVRVGMEASGHGRWFERLMGELGIELWIGDAAEIRTKRVRKQKLIGKMPNQEESDCVHLQLRNENANPQISKQSE
ncbi:MAG: hypothetical protein WA655_02200 [Candidatus Korobacteraceae bacterium]